MFIGDFQSNSNMWFLPPKDQSIGVFINQEFFTLSNQSIMHFYLLMLRAKQSIMSFPQSPGANESPLAELTTFSARVNVTPFSINGHRVDKGPQIWVESIHSSKRRINRGFSLIVEFKFDFIDSYLIDRRFSAGVSSAGQSNQIGSHQRFFLQYDIIQSTDISDRNSCTSTSTSSFSKGEC